MKSYAAFITHASPEAALAICLKDWLESTFTGHVDVFVSSDARDIRAGDTQLLRTLLTRQLSF